MQLLDSALNALNSNKENKTFPTQLNKTSIRLNFLKKVYSILAAQLLATTALCMFTMNSLAFQRFQAASPSLWMFSNVIGFICVLAITCFRDLARSVPTNYCLLGLFTLTESYSVSYICSQYDSSTVVTAAFLTFGIALSLTLYAMTTKKDFTYSGGLLFMLLGTSLFIGLILLFTRSPVLSTIYSGLGAIIFGVYLVYDTQLIIGGKRCEITVDDYILASLMIYQDVIIMFIKILRFFNKKDDEKNKKK